MSKSKKLLKKYLGVTSKKASHNSFWSDEFDVDYSSDVFKESLSEAQIDTLKKYRLSSARKAISNFVAIATGKNVPVQFSTGRESYTDGTVVTLSGDIDDSEKFDVGVGLALHEGSHILLSDFNLLKALGTIVPAELIKAGEQKGDYNPMATIQNILNVVEDRRIDNYIYTNAPGYREYYLKLYDHYFGDKLITEAMSGDEWKGETLENYLNRVINFMNPSTSLSALKGLRQIWSVLDINNIGRLKNTHQALLVALDIYRVIIGNLPDAPLKGNGGSEGDEKEQGNNGQSKGQAGGGDEGESNGGESVEGEGEGDGDDSESGPSTPSKPGKGSNGMSSAKQKRLEKLLKDQKDFLGGNTKKKKVNKKLAEEIDAVEQSGAEIVRAGEGLIDRYGNVTKGVEVIVYKTLNRKMMDDGTIKIASPVQILSDNDIIAAERMGTQLGKKLQVRNEARTTVFNRQRNGKIDKRLVHSLGFDAESVFTQLHVDKYKTANIHLSLDASSSMSGRKWNQTMINTIALAKAVSMISNLSMQVSIRYTEDHNPAVVIAWDSRKDSYKKVRLIFPFLRAYGTTPEGLCFEAISKLIVPPTADRDSYFVNISDGEPCYSTGKFNYVGTLAYNHTRREIERIEKLGVGVLSYFVSDYEGGSSNRAFTQMYGKNARFITLTSVNEVSNTLNKMFLSKSVN